MFFLQQTINGLSNGGVFALYALGFGLVIANFGVFHVAHAAIFTWGALFAWEISHHLHAPLWVALPVAAIAAGLMNCACYLLLIRHLERRPNKQMDAFISSLGGLIALTQLAALILNNNTVSFPDKVFPVRSWQFGGLYVSSIQTLLFGVAVVGMAALTYLLRRTNLGRQIRAVAFDRQVAGMLGANVDRVSLAVFFISGLFAGASATLIGVAFSNVSSNLGGSYLVLALAAMVIGGFGSLAGVVIGGFLIGLANSYSIAYISSGFANVVVFGLMLTFLVVRPTGLFSRATSVARV